MLAPSAVEAYKYPMFKSVEMTKDDIKAKEVHHQGRGDNEIRRRRGRRLPRAALGLSA